MRWRYDGGRWRTRREIRRKPCIHISCAAVCLLPVRFRSFPQSLFTLYPSIYLSIHLSIYLSFSFSPSPHPQDQHDQVQHHHLPAQESLRAVPPPGQCLLPLHCHPQLDPAAQCFWQHCRHDPHHCRALRHRHQRCHRGQVGRRRRSGRKESMRRKWSPLFTFEIMCVLFLSRSLFSTHTHAHTLSLSLCSLSLSLLSLSLSALFSPPLSFSLFPPPLFLFTLSPSQIDGGRGRTIK